MSDTRFDVTFIRGPRDVSPWKQCSRRIQLLTNSPQNGEDALRARSAYHELRDGEACDTRFPNATYQEKGRVR